MLENLRMSRKSSNFAAVFESQSKTMAYIKQHITCKSEQLFRSLCLDTIRESRCCLCMDSIV